MQTLGINIGSTSLKMVIVEQEKIIWSKSLPHEGDFISTVYKLIKVGQVPAKIPTFVTGNEGRLMFNLPGNMELLCLEEALKTLALQANAIISLGGEDIIVYTLSDYQIVNSFSGNKCSSGTGEFLKQQLARMDMKLEDLAHVPPEAKVYPLSTRCSVFMKSDCTHRLNKREATKYDIALSLCDVMAVKVIDFLKRARITSGKVILIGGTTLNQYVVKFIKEKAPGIEFLIPPQAHVFEALGAALLARTQGCALPEPHLLMCPQKIKFSTLAPLPNFQGKITNLSLKTGQVKAGHIYILGVDGGSTTTKACLVDSATDEIVASHYARTHGDPVQALKECLQVLQNKIMQDIGTKEINIKLVATTGSSREILGVFLQTQGVYNEITAHAVGSTYFDRQVETILEIGGQDAKYIYLKNGVPIDYAMNEACSAGTGSFIEESAAGDLSIFDVTEIGSLALGANAPLKFGEHCSAFINSDIRKAVQQGASRENITAGIIYSIVANYLNRVVGNRRIGKKIFLQGGVAKNQAVPLAFAMMLDKEILIPPLPELMGCFGVALLAKQKYSEQLLTATNPNISALLTTEINYERVFKCQACDNLCPIQVLNVNSQKYMFGGRCNKYTNLRKAVEDVPVFDYVEKRQEMLFKDFAAPTIKSTGDIEVLLNEHPRQRTITIGIPKALSVYTLYPLYTWYFYELGIRTFLSEEISPIGVARTESEYCFPAEIAHGAVQDCLDRGADYVLLPHFRDMPSYEDDVHATFCPITQALPYYIEKAFPDVPKEKWLPLVVSFKYNIDKALELFTELNHQLGISTDEARKAFSKALLKQNDYFAACRELGEQALADAINAQRPVIALLGRPYNAYTPDANMGIPLKFMTRGYSIIPFDILPFEEQEIFPNMYWYYGQQVVKTAQLIKDYPIYICYITNFSCAPDSFLLHYIGWIMESKPYLVLELDNHTADAGLDTRIEAFLDIVDRDFHSSATKHGLPRAKSTRDFGSGMDWKFIYDEKAERLSQLRLENNHTKEKINIRYNKRVKVLLANMGAITTEYLGASLRSIGIPAEVLPVATGKTVQTARAHASGKECVPSHLVLGSALEFLKSDKYKKEEIYLLFVPITLGPCRTGQYFVYYENLFKDLGIKNIVIFTLSDENSYTELDANFGKVLWKGLVLSDYIKDMQNTLLATAQNTDEAQHEFTNAWQNLIYTVEHEPTKLWDELKILAARVQQIPLKKNPREFPKVMVVGEIYVRRDDFAIEELTKLISENGIIVKVAGISEWIHYLDFNREYNLKKLIKLRKKNQRLLSPPWRELQQLKLEKWWKKSIEKKILSILGPTNLIPETPHDMQIIMKQTQDHFISLELNSEIAVSTGSAATVMEHGYSGVVNISPFACLIGRVIQGIYTPWARERNYPILSMEIDGYSLPPNLINKLNIFIINVLRFKNV